MTKGWKVISHEPRNLLATLGCEKCIPCPSSLWCPTPPFEFPANTFSGKPRQFGPCLWKTRPFEFPAMNFSRETKAVRPFSAENRLVDREGSSISRRKRCCLFRVNSAHNHNHSYHYHSYHYYHHGLHHNKSTKPDLPWLLSSSLQHTALSYVYMDVVKFELAWKVRQWF